MKDLSCRRRYPGLGAFPAIRRDAHTTMLPAIHSPIALTVLVATGLCAIMLVAPGETVSSKYFNDLLVFLDGGYRTTLGQVPSRDFHTALGPLSFYIPGLGYWLSGRLGMAMPLGMTALMLVTAPIMIHVLQTRLRPLIAVPTAMVLLLLLAALLGHPRAAALTLVP